jgi:pSer/pThr/pTyr-binding forkhead associated (FHA) protein
LFRLRIDSIRIGRIDPKAEKEYDQQHDIALSQKYVAVSRVWRPHARLIREENEWFIEHCEGSNGTYLENRKLEKHVKEKLRDHNVVDLAIGEGSARLVFLAPEFRDDSPAKN